MAAISHGNIGLTTILPFRWRKYQKARDLSLFIMEENQASFEKHFSYMNLDRKKGGYYHNEMDSKNDAHWLKKILLTILPSNSILAIDNSSYHIIPIEKPPTTKFKERRNKILAAGKKYPTL
jgi:hypothetical protein